ncbi:MAG: hypothetical protein KJ964_12630 [Verrucomicrobia bacterium]|nr:hypothetical protein [Verrucomicrobiota bacterium]MBU1734235.1 hypothetical protein [Verrucomicrobiota bacterium]MBU1857389.1 hypothetical protein [Verrucomicrobiota bacterium]
MQRSCVLIIGLMVSGFACIQMAGATTNYVDRYGTNPTPNYTNWATAAVSIQDAVDVAILTPGNTVLVSNGVYDTGGTITPSYALTNRVCATAAITIQSVNGPNYTSIKGQPSPNGLMGTGAVRCVYLAGGASLIGFTLTNGYAMTNGAVFYDRTGGGVWINASGSVSNCVMVGNYAYDGGGGASLFGGGTLNNCIISNNFSWGYGGGVYLYSGGAKMNNCIVVGNVSTNFGGGLCMNSSSEANNCLIAGNTNTNYGSGGAFLWNSPVKLNSCTIVGNNGGTKEGGGLYFYSCSVSLTNCIVWGNTSTTSSSNYYGASAQTFSYTCSGPVKDGTGNTGSDPQFIGQAAGNYRLGENSPCVNAGIYQSWMTGAADLDGHRRLDKFSGIVDIGCYEYVPKGMLVTVP